ncbi:MAG: hypothetical protein LUG99_18690 [Lachnospiraceae bacterium]|nr:hypothetical protein [Lachnospiraceae bacterium]
MTTSLIQESDTRYVKEMHEYVFALKKQQNEAPDMACADAKKALIRTGVTTSTGVPKEKIVTWE